MYEQEDNLIFRGNRGFEIIETSTGFKFLIQPRGDVAIIFLISSYIDIDASKVLFSDLISF
jgi:hypothetical protein